MDKIIDALTKLRAKIGDRSYIAIILAIVVLLAGKQLCPLGSSHCVAIVRIVAGSLFVFGLAQGLGQVYAPVILRPAGRGFGDGVTCGVLAGFVGGIAGYGAHSAADGWTEGTAYRILIVVAFATPLGGVMGVCFSLVKPNIQIDWRAHFGVLLGGMTIAFGGLALIVTTAIPGVQHRGILLRDVQLVFEIFLAFSIALVAIEDRWKLAKIIATYGIVSVFIIVGRFVTHFLPVNISEYGVSHLSEIEFFLPDGFWNFLLTFFVGFMGTISVYTIVVRESSLSGWLDRKLRTGTNAQAANIGGG